MSLEFALSLARKGYAVFPVGRDKAPIFYGGHKSATLDEAEIRRLWGAAGDAAVGICPGRCDPALIALDVDAPDGWRSLDPLLAVNDPVQSTPSGGGHYLFRSDGGEHRNTVGALGPGLDTRGTNGYIVAYADLPDPWTLPEAPDWLLNVGRKSTEPLEAAAPSYSSSLAAADIYLSAAPAAEEGARNHTAFKVAARLRNLGLDQKSVFEKLCTWNTAKCHPPLGDDELASVVVNAFAYSQEGARQDPFLRTAEFVERVARHKPLPLKVYHEGEIADMPAPTWLVEDLIVEGTLNMVVGQYGSYKSFFVLDMALALATGTPVLEKQWRVAAPKKVLYVATEGRADFSLRYQAWCRGRSTRYPPNFGVTFDPVSLSDPKSVEDLKATASEYDVLVIDTLARVAFGFDENNNQEASMIVKLLEGLGTGRTTPLTTILVHHSSKHSELPRGATALPAAADTIIRVERLSPDRGRVHCIKNKACSAFDPFDMEARTIWVGDRSSLVFTAAGLAEKSIVAKFIGFLRQHSGPMDKADLREYVRTQLDLIEGPELDEAFASFCRELGRRRGKLSVHGHVYRHGGVILANEEFEDAA